jgi:predicted transposase YbfD/YdcC
VLAALDPALFKACFANLVEGLREAGPNLIAIDGKTSRGIHARNKGREPLHLVSAWASRQRLVLGQEAVRRKSNEITAIPLLLERLALKGALVTIDAIGTQNEIATAILGRGGDYLLAPKASRPATFKDVETFFADPSPDGIKTSTTTDGDHGRIDVRRHAVRHDVAWLFSGRRYPGEVAFPGLRHDRDGRERDPARRQGQPRAARLPVLGQAGRRHLRPCRPRPLGNREPPAPDLGRSLRGRSGPPAQRPRAREHGCGQTHGHKPTAPS